MANWIKRRGVWRRAGVSLPRSVARSIRIDASGKGIRRRLDQCGSSPGDGGNTLPVNAWTISGWFYFHQVRSSAWQFFLGAENALSSADEYLAVGWTNGGDSCASHQSGTVNFSTAIPTGEWVFVAATCGPNTNPTYRDFIVRWRRASDSGFPAAQTITFGLKVDVDPVWHFVWGNDGYEEWCDCSVAQPRLWSATLSEAELLAESQSPRKPARTSNIYAHASAGGPQTPYLQDGVAAQPLYPWSSNEVNGLTTYFWSNPSQYAVGQAFTWPDGPQAIRAGTSTFTTSSADNGSAGITVPSDADYCVLFVDGWDNTPQRLSNGTVSIGGTSMALLAANDLENTHWNSAAFGLDVRNLRGAQTLAWNWADSGDLEMSSGRFCLLFVKNTPTTNVVRGVATASWGANPSTPEGSASVDARPGDILVGISYCYSANAAPSLTNATAVHSYGGSAYATLFQNLAPTQRTTVTTDWTWSTDGDGGIILLTLRAGEAGAADTSLAASVSSTATGTATLTNGGAVLASSVSGTATGSATLTNAIRLASSVSGSATATGTLTNAIQLVASVSGTATGAAELTTAGQAAALASSVSVTATGAATLTTAIRLDCSATATTLGSPSAVAQGTALSDELGPDGTTWPNCNPVVVDQYGKVLLWEQQNAGVVFPIVSNDGGATWSQPTCSGMYSANGEGFIQRGACAYDSINDIFHVLWECQSNTDGILYRRYSVTRDGSNNITGLTRVAGINLQLDYQAGVGNMTLRFPTLLFCADIGSHGALVAGWAAENQGVGTEFRLSMRALSNTTADNTAGNWAAPAGASTTGITQSPAVAYTRFGTTSGLSSHTMVRPASGAHANDLYLFWHDYPGGGYGMKWCRAQWNSGNSNWSTGLTTATTILSNLIVSGSGGYTLRHELMTKAVHDATHDRVYVGAAIWKSNADGDTQAVWYVDSSDALSSRIDVASAGGASTFAPVLDLMFDVTADRLVVSYQKGSDVKAYFKLYDGTTLAQGETALWTTKDVDIPLLADRRVNGKVLSVFRDHENGTPPYDGYAVTLTWSGGAGGVVTTATGTAALTNAIGLAASVSGTATGTAVLTTSVALATSVSASATGTADLTAPGPQAGDLDTREKRASAFGFNQPWLLVLPVADNTLSVYDLHQLLGLYAGYGEVTAAALEANAVGTATGSATLTTSIPLAASVTATATSASTLTSNLSLIANVSGTATGAASVTSALRFATSVSGVATGAATLTTATNLATAVVSTATAAATLSTGLQLTSAVSGVATVAADLSTGVSLVAAAASTATAVASVTNSLVLAANVQGTATATADLTAPGQAADLRASVSGTATGTATLTSSIQLVANVASTATADATITGFRPLAANIAGTATATDALTTSIPLTANISGTATAATSVTTTPRLVANISGTAASTAAVTTGVALAANVSGTATSTAALTNAIGLVSNVSSTATAVAILTTPGQAAELLGNISGTATSAATVTTSIRLAANVSGTATAAATPTTDIRLATAVSSAATSTANLTAPAGLAASVSGTAAAVAAVTNNIRLVTAISSTATATATLTKEIPLAANVSGAATSAATLTTAVRMATAVAVTAVAATDLTTNVRLASAVSSTASASTSVVTGVQLYGAANIVANNVATLTTQIPLAASISSVVDVWAIVRVPLPVIYDRVELTDVVVTFSELKPISFGYSELREPAILSSTWRSTKLVA